MTIAAQPAAGVNPDTSAPVCFAVDIMLAMAADAGLNVYFRPMTFGELQQSLLGTKIDIIAGTFGIMPERQKVVAFTQSRGAYNDVLFVKASDRCSYGSVADLKGKKIDRSRRGSYVKPLEVAGAEAPPRQRPESPSPNSKPAPSKT
ncbi:MAG: transporter substrate-binding domain-containing protein [Hyphomicrobiales bacterium]|nr:transporter substrate-binding domain-containing protein [Rhodoblastus sp.]MCC2114010.1 transporter substrate-binding domain-containing protein [Hyphomicrobiales bacterium]